MTPLKLVYAGLFGLAGVGCLAGFRAARSVPVPDVARGLRWLLGSVAVWAVLEGARTLIVDPTVSVALYLVGLVVGLVTVGSWLYFCSAYAGHEYHHSTVVRRVFAGLFVLAAALKLCNPLHGWYFDVQVVAAPFSHVAIMQSGLHWAVVGVAYALSAVGFFMLFDLFASVERDTRGLAALVGLAGVPVVANVAGATLPGVLYLNYEPLGVAAFAAGVLYVADDAFLAVHREAGRRAIDHVGEAVLVVDGEGQVRDTNEAARRLVGIDVGALPVPLRTVAPALPAQGDDVVHVDERWVRVTERPLRDDATTRVVVLTDVTESVEQGRELRRQNEQLEAFAAAITHELRNALTVVGSHLDLAGRRLDGSNESRAARNVATADRAAERATRIVGDLATLARKGQTVGETEACEFRAVAETAWETAETDGLTLSLDGAGTVEADRRRLTELFGDAFAFARANGADRVTVALTDDGFTVTDDGTTPRPGRYEDLFSYGTAVPDADTGMLLPMVETLATAHGWSVDPDEEYDGGVRYHVRGVTVGRTCDGRPLPGPTGRAGQA